jgi:CrcB protein
MTVLMVALGGAFGAVARFGLGGWVQSVVDTTFPLGTLFINVLGSFLLGFSLPFFEGLAWSADTRTLVTIGFLGAFTTFSTFSYEAVVLLEGGEWGRGAFYVIGTFLLGLAGLVSGLTLASLILQTRS